MDAVTQKFSVFDFFNLLIAGTIFLSALVLCHYPQSLVIIEAVSKKISDSNFLLIMFVILYVGCTLVIGMVFQVIGHWFVKEAIGWEYKSIGNCLSGKGILKNDIRTKRLLYKASNYLKLNGKEQKLSEEETSAFFAHCVYKLHIKGLDNKTEKLRETQGLSELFACVFWFMPLISIYIFLLQWLVCHNMSFDLRYTIITYLACIILGFIFYFRYKVSGRNRIRMILSIYDAYTEGSDT